MGRWGVENWGGAAKTSSRVFRQMRAHGLDSLSAAQFPVSVMVSVSVWVSLSPSFPLVFLHFPPIFPVLTHRLGLLQLQLLLRLLHERAVLIRTLRLHLGAHGEHVLAGLFLLRRALSSVLSPGALW